MLLDEKLCLQYCEKPQATADLMAGRLLEGRHLLHVDGDKARVTAFLTEKKPSLLASPEAFTTMKEVQVSASATLYDGFTNILGKALTARGRNFYYQFKRPELAQEFDAFLKDTKRTGQSVYNQFRTTWFRAMLVGFQGVLLVDLPADAAPDAAPAPYFSYIPSGEIHDLKVTCDRIEYLILRQDLEEGATRYFCYDDAGCHKVLHKSGSYTYEKELLTLHGLGYVPACPVTTRKVDPLRPRLRTSPLAKSLERADEYLLDSNWHALGKAYHANPKMWSYGVPCTHTYVLSAELLEAGCVPLSCNAGQSGYFDGVNNILKTCPRCGGQGRYVPVGPEKAFIVQVPTDKEAPSIVNPGPVGYIVPDLTSLEYLGQECEKNEGRIEKAVLGKEGITEMQTKQDTLGGKLLDLGPVADRLTGISEDGEFVFKFITNTLARYQYPDDFQESEISLGRDYLLKSVGQLEADFAAAKKAGIDDAVLYAYLEEIIYSKWAGNPMELQRNLLKLELTPCPTQTVAEAKLNGVMGPDDLLLKTYINDFFDRFERENGSILEFASLLSHGEKINRIKAVFNTYLIEKRPAVAATPGAFTAGDSVMVKPGKAHMPAHEDLMMTVAQVQGDTYAVKLPDGSIHKWYTADELMGMSPAAKSTKAPAMAM